MIAKKTMINRPTNLSEWVFFSTEKDRHISPLLGGDCQYNQLVRAANKPVISIQQKSRDKYRFLDRDGYG